MAKGRPWAPVARFNRGNSGPIRFPISSGNGLQRLGRADHDLKFGHFARIAGFDEIGTERSRPAAAAERCRRCAFIAPRAPVHLLRALV
jgi:hypothetical protein